MRKLQKKLRQIEAIQSSGKVVDADQQSKLDSKAEVLSAIASLEADADWVKV